MAGTTERTEYGLGELREQGTKWYGRWRSPDGTKRNRSLGTIRRRGSSDGLSRAEARARLREMMAEDANRSASKNCVATVGTLGGELLERLANRGRSRSTLEAVESHVRVHLDPCFGDTPVDSIGRANIERFIAHERRAGLAPKSIRNYLGTLHSIFDLAIRQELIGHNPCRVVDKPGSASSVNNDIHFLTLDELEAVLRCAQNDDVGRVERVLWLTCALVGMRMGETRGFRWRDIDWVASRVRIRQTYVRREFKAPKSKRSSRSVPLARRVARELELLSRETAFRGDDGLVFAHPHTGKPLDGSKCLKRYKQACRTAGVTKTNRLHDLRHTFGTRLAAQGVPMRTLQEWMGHRDFKTTLIYADYAPGAREAEWIDAAFSTEASRESLGSAVPELESLTQDARRAER